MKKKDCASSVGRVNTDRVLFCVRLLALSEILNLHTEGRDSKKMDMQKTSECNAEKNDDQIYANMLGVYAEIDVIMSGIAIS